MMMAWKRGYHDQNIRDTLAEWLRRRPAKPMWTPCVGSNPTGVAVRNGLGKNPAVMTKNKQLDHDRAEWFRHVLRHG